MALPAESAHAEQIAIASLAVPLAQEALDVLDGPSLAEAARELLESVEAIIREYGAAAAGAAVEWFRAARLDAGVRGRVSIPPVAPAREVLVRSAVAAGGAARLVGEPDVLGSMAEGLVLDEGRRQMMSAVQADREAKGWARTTQPGACSFCLMLAIRAGAGVLYMSRESANFRAHTAQANGSGGTCRCGVEPVWSRYEPPAHLREAQALWARATKGRSGHDARVAFRQAVEGRPVTGAPGKSSSSRSSGKRQHYADPSGRTPESQAAQLRLLESLPPAKTPEAADWQAARIKEIRDFLKSHPVS